MTEYKLKEFTHFLKDAESISVKILSEVTHAQVAEYKIEYSEFKNDWDSDRAISMKKKSLILQEIQCLYGDGKQFKYLDRTFHSGKEKSLVDKHYQSIPCPSKVERLLKDAKTKVTARNAITATTLSDEDIAGLDEAIKFLSSEGMVYGSDFNAYNAVQIAKTTSHVLFSRMSESEKLSHFNIPSCSICENPFANPLADDNGIVSLKCNCWNNKRQYQIELTNPLTFTELN